MSDILRHRSFVTYLQKEMDKEVQELQQEKQEAIEARDKEWTEKMKVKVKFENYSSLSVSLNVWTQRFNVTISWQEEELVLASEQQLHRALEERGQEMALAIEERDLQKMAALSQQDSEKDRLQQVINQLQKVL